MALEDDDEEEEDEKENDVKEIKAAFISVSETASESEQAVATSKSKYIRLQALPNVHAGLHIADNVDEYSTVMNCNVLVNELKHKTFKCLADNAAPPNLMGYLFSQDVTSQSIRLGLAGSWASEYPELAQALAVVEEQCPALVRSFQPLAERDPLEQTFTDSQVLEDNEHKDVSLTIKGFNLNTGRNDLHLQATINASRLQVNSPFLQSLRQAFRTDYRVTGITNFRGTRIQWKKRLAFTDQRGRRHVYNVDDYILLRGDDSRTFSRLRQFFVFFFQDQAYAFAVVDVLEVCYAEAAEGEGSEEDRRLIDPVLNLWIYKVTSQKVCGLPSISIQSLYLIPAPMRGIVDLEEGDYAVWCNWDLDIQ